MSFGARTASSSFQTVAVMLPTYLNVQDFGIGYAYAEFVVSSSGIYYDQNYLDPTTGTWLLSGSASAYEIMFTLESGSVQGSATSVWLSLGSSVSWSATAINNSQNFFPIVTEGGFGTLEIRLAATQEILTRSTLYVTADAYGGNPP